MEYHERENVTLYFRKTQLDPSFFFNLVTIDSIRVMFLSGQVETTRQQILELEVSDQQP